MKIFLLSAVFIILLFIVPALYAAALVCLTVIFGESVSIHLLVFAVFMLVFIYIIYAFYRNRTHRRDADGAENQENDL